MPETDVTKKVLALVEENAGCNRYGCEIQDNAANDLAGELSILVEEHGPFVIEEAVRAAYTHDYKDLDPSAFPDADSLMSEVLGVYGEDNAGEESE